MCFRVFSLMVYKIVYFLPLTSIHAGAETQGQSEVKNKGFLRSFLEMHIVVHMPWPSRFSQICWNFSKTPDSLFFLLNILVSHLLTLTHTATSLSYNVKQLLLIFSTNTERIELFSHREL